MDDKFDVVGTANCLKPIVESPGILRVLNLINNGSIHKVKSLKPIITKNSSEKVILLSRKSYRIITDSYPPKYPPYPPFNAPKFPLHQEIASLSLPVDPSSNSEYPDSSF